MEAPHRAPRQPHPFQGITEDLTVGVIARRLGVPVHRVSYLIRTRLFVPRAKAGAAFVFDAATVEAIAAEIGRMSKSQPPCKEEVRRD